MKLPRDLKAQINKMAHAAGLAHGEQMKARLSDEVARRMAAGESFDTISAYLDHINPPQRRTGDWRYTA